MIMTTNTARTVATTVSMTTTITITTPGNIYLLTTRIPRMIVNQAILRMPQTFVEYIICFVMVSKNVLQLITTDLIYYRPDL